MITRNIELEECASEADIKSAIRYFDVRNQLLGTSEDMKTDQVVLTVQFEDIIEMEIKDRVKKLKEVHKIQGSSGNWDVNRYQCGMFNVLELAVATIEGRTPVYRTLDDKN